ncbi:hypothetical protein [Desulfogranum marinum]|uniref:hypothetical protein n=1 Tax=Desulfogranum marinum TaxID=453220 RepID=UPI0029C79371|nr:hypothetical protein [Desulfogranum marinum]
MKVILAGRTLFFFPFIFFCSFCFCNDDLGISIAIAVVPPQGSMSFTGGEVKGVYGEGQQGDAFSACHAVSAYQCSTAFQYTTGKNICLVGGWCGDWKYIRNYISNQTYAYYLYHPDYVPQEPCVDEIDAATDLCGSANYTINLETCSYSCLCDPDTMQAKLDTCEEGGTPDVDYNKCTVTCEECTQEKADLEAECGAAGVTGVGPGGCGGRCRNCSDYWNDAAEDCSTRGGVVDGWCRDTEGKISGKIDWTCATELPDEPTPEPEKAETPPEKKPEKEPKPDAPADDPNNPALDENRNKWLEAIKGDLDTRIQQGNEEQEFLANIAENAKRMTDNQSILAKGLDGIASAVKKLDSTVANSGNSGTEVNLDNSGIESRLDGIGEKIEELTPGDDFDEITTSDFDEAYSLDEEFDVSDRFGTFVDTIKTTGLFSVPDQFFGSLPSGGSSVIHIDAGQYGDHSVDLNDTLGPGLLVLRSIFVIIFGFLSIRAVVMKR